MKKLSHLFLCLALTFAALPLFGQVANPDFDRKIQSLIQESVPVISAEALSQKLYSGKPVLLIDARSPQEYDVSHLPEARFVDFNHFEKAPFEVYPKDTEVVVYCSVGYRSEKIGEKLEKMGFTNVKNLYGGIFEWVNSGNQVVNNDGEETDQVHTYNQKWSQWLEKGEKIYD